MSNATALVIGALIALVGSIAGGFVTPLILSWIDGKRSDRERSRIATETRKHELGIGIRELLEALLEQFAHQGGASLQDDADKIKRVLMAGLDLGLLLEQHDQAIASIATSASALVIEGGGQGGKALTSLTSVLPAWRRGVMTSWETLDAYRLATGDPVPIKDEATYRAAPENAR